MSYGIIIQSRFSSSRLPGKALLKIKNKEMLLRQIERLQHFTLFRISGLTEILIVILLYNFLPRETANFDLKTEDKSAIR